jgi:hypothetical protein
MSGERMTEPDENVCGICDERALRQPWRYTEPVLDFHCMRCGHYRVTTEAFEEHLQSKELQFLRGRHLLMALSKRADTFDHAPMMLTTEWLAGFLAAPPTEKTLSERIELMVRWFVRRSTHFGDSVKSNPSIDYPAAWCRSPVEWSALWKSVIELGYLKHIADNETQVTTSGWQ